MRPPPPFLETPWPPPNWLRLGLAAALVVAFHAHAILFYATDDPWHNTTAPTGSLTNSGWQWQGTFGYFLGTPIAPRYFISAKHIPGTNGQVFEFQGRNYIVAGTFEDPNSDLRICRVHGIFPTFAPLYPATNEVGLECVAFGRGTRRGTNVLANGPGQPRPRGWAWGPSDGLQRWGQNRIEEAMTLPTYGELLRASFDTNGLPDECHFSTGDSGGGLFLNDGTGWKLAGIHFSVSGPYRLVPEGPDLSAALFDEGGLYVLEDDQWVQLPTHPSPRPGSFYSTRIATRLTWIQSVLHNPIPADEQLILQSAPTPSGPYTDEPGAVIDETERTIRWAAPSGSCFLRTRSSFAVRLFPAPPAAGEITLHFE